MQILKLVIHTLLLSFTLRNVVVVTQAKELVNRNTYPPLVIHIKDCSSFDTGQGISQQEYIPSSCHLH
jgi:hypothetical protein